LSNANIESFDYAVNKSIVKFLKTTNTDIVKYCQDQCSFKLSSQLIAYCTEKFMVKLQVSSCA